MGLTASKPESPYAKLKEQLETLGNRHPFGDADLLRVSRCLAYLYSSTTNPTFDSQQEIEDGKEEPIGFASVSVGNSFLSDWAVYCSTLPSADFSRDVVVGKFDDLLLVDPKILAFEASIKGERSKIESTMDEIIVERQRISYVMKIIEEHVLPPNFGEILHRRVFSPVTSDYKNGEPNASEIDINGKITWDKLDKFLNGISDSSMRGSRKALTSLFRCCCRSNPPEGNGMANAYAPAKDLIDLAYRLSLATAIYDGYMMYQSQLDLKKIHDRQREINKKEKEAAKAADAEKGVEEDDEDDDEEEEEEMIVPIFNPASLYPKNIGNSLVQSLLDFSSSSNQPASPSYGMSGPDLNQSGLSASSGNKTTKRDSNVVSLNIFLTWSESVAPCLSSCLETFIHRIFFPDKPYPPSRTEFIFPNLRGRHSAFFPSPASPYLFNFASMTPSLGGAWHRLYTSDEDGLSFNRLQNSLLGYSGPTLTVIKEVEGGGIFGAYTHTAWKESKDFYGDSNCFLFTIAPSVSVLRPRGVGNKYMYCNSESRSRGYDGQAHGIGFGGTVDKPRLFISESFDECMAATGDLTFEAGPLLPKRNVDGDFGNPNPSKYFDLESLEVWGVGGDEVVAEALGDRHKQREIVAANIRKARKVDKAQFLDDFQSGLIESKAFNHRAQMRGRGDCRADDDKKNNYVYE